MSLVIPHDDEYTYIKKTILEYYVLARFKLIVIHVTLFLCITIIQWENMRLPNLIKGLIFDSRTLWLFNFILIFGCPHLCVFRNFYWKSCHHTPPTKKPKSPKFIVYYRVLVWWNNFEGVGWCERIWNWNWNLWCVFGI